MARGLVGFREQAENQAKFFVSRGIPIYASVLTTALEMIAAGEGHVPSVLEEAWKDREFSSPYERALLLCASMRFEALRDSSHPLAEKIGDDADGQGRVTREELDRAIDFGRTRDSLVRRFVQTNEVSRSITWQLAATCFEGDGPIVVIDLGTSAGATLVGDRIAQNWQAADGSPIVLGEEKRARKRYGLDRRPVDLADSDQEGWLRACIWPGQRDRVLRFRRAVEEVKKAKAAGELVVSKMGAEDMVAFVRQIANENPGARILVAETAFIDYLPPDIRAPFEKDLGDFISAHPGRAVWSGLEDALAPVTEGGGKRFPAEIRLRRASRMHVVARCEWHPSVVAIDHAELAKARTPH